MSPLTILISAAAVVWLVLAIVSSERMTRVVHMQFEHTRDQNEQKRAQQKHRR